MNNTLKKRFDFIDFCQANGTPGGSYLFDFEERKEVYANLADTFNSLLPGV